MKALTDSEIRADRLRSEIVQLEAQYDECFRPGLFGPQKPQTGSYCPQ